MNLPDFIAADPATLALIVRAKVTRELPGASYDDAWDKLDKPEEYQPTDEVQAWMRENWHGPVFGTQAQVEEPPIVTPNYPVSHARTWMQPFLDAFVATGGNATKAAAAAGVYERTPYKAREVDKDFAAAWEWAERKIADVIREELHRRGVEGWDEPVYGTKAGKFAGEGCVGAVRRFDSHILLKMATARVPEYRTLVKEGAAQISNTASASASATTNVTLTPKRVEELQERNRRQLEKQAKREAKLQQAQNARN